MLASTSNPFFYDFHVDLFRIFSAFVDNGAESCTISIVKKEYPKVPEVCTDLLSNVDASLSPSEPN